MHLEQYLTQERELRQTLDQVVPELELRWQHIPNTTIEGFLLEELSASVPLSPRSTERVMDSPPFWSLLWPAGHHLCHVLQGTDVLLKDRTLVDLGCGSGLVCVAAARAGARVQAVDSDPLSRVVTALNCARNGVVCDISDRWSGSCDTLLLADFLYDERNLEAVLEFCARCREIVIVDSRLEKLDVECFRTLGKFEGRAFPDLDPHREFGALAAWYFGYRFGDWQKAFAGLSSSP
jgi:predicted nicotinamide N-methyase